MQAFEDGEIEKPRIADIVTEDVAVAVFLCRPEIIPQAPEVAAPEVLGDQPMEVRQAFFGEDVESDGDAGVVRDGACAVPQLGEFLFVDVIVLVGREKVGGIPQLAFLFVLGNELFDDALEVHEDFEFRSERFGEFFQLIHCRAEPTVVDERWEISSRLHDRDWGGKKQ